MNPSRSEELIIEKLDSPQGACVIRLIGPLTLKTLFEFQQFSRTETARPIIVEISGVPYMDSAGLGSIISLFASCQRTHRGFAIIGISERIHTLFEVTQCDGLLPCFESLEAADNAVAKHA